jgi:hypothetical protein
MARCRQANRIRQGEGCFSEMKVSYFSVDRYEGYVVSMFVLEEFKMTLPLREYVRGYGYYLKGEWTSHAN